MCIYEDVRSQCVFLDHGRIQSWLQDSVTGHLRAQSHPTDALRWIDNRITKQCDLIYNMGIHGCFPTTPISGGFFSKMLMCYPAGGWPFLQEVNNWARYLLLSRVVYPYIPNYFKEPQLIQVCKFSRETTSPRRFTPVDRNKMTQRRGEFLNLGQPWRETIDQSPVE